LVSECIKQIGKGIDFDEDKPTNQERKQISETSENNVATESLLLLEIVFALRLGVTLVVINANDLRFGANRCGQRWTDVKVARRTKSRVVMRSIWEHRPLVIN